jgi:hypothetical protein
LKSFSTAQNSLHKNNNHNKEIQDNQIDEIYQEKNKTKQKMNYNNYNIDILLFKSSKNNRQKSHNQKRFHVGFTFVERKNFVVDSMEIFVLLMNQSNLD